MNSGLQAVDILNHEGKLHISAPQIRALLFRVLNILKLFLTPWLSKFSIEKKSNFHLQIEFYFLLQITSLQKLNYTQELIEINHHTEIF